MPEPIVPMELFTNRVYSTANAASFIVNMAFMGVVAFLPLFMQVGQGVAATRAGWRILPMMVGLIFASTACRLPGLADGPLQAVHAGRRRPADDRRLPARPPSGRAPAWSGLAWRMLIVGLGLGPSQSLSAWRSRTPCRRTRSAWRPAAASSSARSARPSGWPCSAPCSPTTSATNWPAARRRRGRRASDGGHRQAAGHGAGARRRRRKCAPAQSSPPR